MANNFTAFFETLVAGADEYNKAKVGRTALLDAVYKDVKPEAARIGKTVDVYFPDVGPLTRRSTTASSSATSVNPNYIPLVFQNRAGAALQFQDFEQWQTAVDLAQKFFDPLYKRAKEYLERPDRGPDHHRPTSTPTPRSSARPRARSRSPTSSTPGTRWPIRRCRSRTRDKLRLMVHNNVYQKMLGDSAWVQESLVSRGDREGGPREGRPGHTPSTSRSIWDQQMPTATRHRSSTARSRSPTARHDRDRAQYRTSRTQLDGVAHGSYLIFGNDSDQDRSTRSARSPATPALTLGSTYAGSTATTTARLHDRARRHLAMTSELDDVTGTSSHFTTAVLGRRQWLQLARRHPPPCTRSRRSPATPASPSRRAVQPAVSGSSVRPRSRATPTWPCTSTPSPWPCGRSPHRTRPATSSTFSYIDLMGIPLRVMVSYVHIYQALFVTVDFGYALGVIRPDFGVIINC